MEPAEPGRAARLVLLLLLLGSLCRPEEEVVMNTKLETSDLRWTSSAPDDQQWEELSGLDDDSNSVRTYQICRSDSSRSYWLRTRWIPLRTQTVLYVEIRFTMMDCSSLDFPQCKETFTVYYLESATDSATLTQPLWMENPYTKVDTVAADHLLRRGGERRSNLKTLRVGPVGPGPGGSGPGETTSGVYLAFQAQGACMALLAVRVYYRKCPPLVHLFTHFPETVPHTLVQQAQGVCVENAAPTPGGGAHTPSMLCGEDGQWVGLPSSSCACRPGYEANQSQLRCRACPSGQFKAAPGLAGCRVCPDYSHTPVPGSAYCLCVPGYYRADSDPAHLACTRPPSSPLRVAAQLSVSTVTLDWSEPSERGGRGDTTYSILCSSCPPEGCVPCGDSVFFQPARSGLSQRRVLVGGLRPHTTYRLTVQSHNGVSALSQSEPASQTVNITTSRDVPAPVGGLRMLRSSESSLTLEWNTPPTHLPLLLILNYQTRYAAEGSDWLYVVSDSCWVELSGLQRATSYRVEVRGRSQGGYGAFSPTGSFSTRPAGSPAHFLLVGISVSMATLLLVVMATAAYWYRRRRRRRAGPDEDLALQHHLMEHSMKEYIDPLTFDDPREAVRSLTREIDPSHVQIEEVIGAGEFGEVCLGRLRTPDRKQNLVAIKTLKVGVTDKQRRDFLSEACIMGQFQHPNILRLEGVATSPSDSSPIMILTEFMENGALDSFLRSDRQLSGLQLGGMLRGVASGMNYLGGRGFVHRDLAARNVLLDTHLVCKVSDFGLSRFLRESSSDPTYTSALGGKIPVRWTAPEAIGQRKFTSASDVWSYGVVMWEVMSYGERPYWDMSNQDVISAVEQGYRLPRPPGCPVSLHTLMLDCWQKQRANRPPFCSLVAALDRLIRSPASLKITHPDGARDLPQVGVALASHQEILSSIQTLRIHETPPTLPF